MATTPSASYIHFTPIPKSAFPLQKLASAKKTIAAEDPTDLQIFTDGSTLNGTENGGAWVVVFRENKLIQSCYAPTGTFSSFCQAMKTALIAAIFWLEQNDDWFSAFIITDCKLLLQACSDPNITDPSLRFLNTSVAAFYPTKSRATTTS